MLFKVLILIFILGTFAIFAIDISIGKWWIKEFKNIKGMLLAAVGHAFPIFLLITILLSFHPVKNIEYKIKLIGEPLLKNALLEKLYSNDNYSPEIENIEHLKAKNKKLAQRVKELEKIIDNEKNKHK